MEIVNIEAKTFEAMLSKFENPQDILKKLEVKAAPRIMK